MISIRGLRKQFDQHVASNNIDLDIPKGAIFGLLGPNGAGKTTLIRMITGIIQADSGSILFNGEALHFGLTSKIGYMPEERGLYKKMKVYEQLVYLGTLRGLSVSEAQRKTTAWLEKLQITDWKNRKVEELSKGMGQKIQFIATVLHEPELIILDEPFSGLDPINAQLIEQEIYHLNQAGATIIFSTHRMEQVEEICEEIALVNKGNIILNGQVKALKQQFKKNLYRVETEGELPTQYPDGITLLEHKHHAGLIRLDNDDSNALLRYLLNAPVKIHSFQELLPGLNEIFIQSVQSHNNE